MPGTGACGVTRLPPLAGEHRIIYQLRPEEQVVMVGGRESIYRLLRRNRLR